MHRICRHLSLLKSSPGVVTGGTAVPKMSAMHSRSFSSGTVQNMNVQEFKSLISSADDSFQSPSTTIENILNDPSVQNQTEAVQIIDVRELSELDRLNFSDHFNRIVHLPLSESEQWAPKIIAKEMLDASKPTVCVCQAGVRSQQMAQFLLLQGGFAQVYNLVGGIGQYEHEVDSSVRKS